MGSGTEQKGVKWGKKWKKLPEATSVTHARRFAETSSWTHVQARWKWGLMHDKVVFGTLI